MEAGRRAQFPAFIIYPFRKKIKRLRFEITMVKENAFLAKIKARASALNKRIVLCEGEDSRVVKAAADAVREGVAKITLLGDPDAIKRQIRTSIFPAWTSSIPQRAQSVRNTRLCCIPCARLRG